jgi:hypothetical protein
MVLSRAMTQFTTIGRSDEATPSRRFMPAIAVDLEDMLDLKSESQALRYVHPPSPSACALQQIHMRFAWSRSERRKGLAASRPRARKSGRALTGEFHARPDGSYGVAYV